MSRRLLAINPVDHPGGAEMTSMLLLDGLRRNGWTTSVTTPGRGPLAEAVERAGFAWHALPLGGLGPGQGMAAVASWPRARRLAAGFDAVLLNGAVCGRLLPVLGLRSRRARVVLHVHDIVPRVPRFWRLADAVVAASGAVARSLGSLATRVVYPPVQTDPPTAPSPWATSDGPVIAFVGRLEPRKGPLDLVRAAAAIRAGAPGARLVLVGDDPYDMSPEYAAVVRAEAAEAGVEHVPWVSNAPGVMRHVDVLVLPAYREPFGTVLAEAMAVGTPVVATRVDGLVEVVEDGVSGRLVAPGDPEALAEAVLDVASRRAEMSAAARVAAEPFLIQRHVDEMEALLAA